MMGRKTLADVRAELEVAFSTGPGGEGEVAQSLRRFLANPGAAVEPDRPGLSVAEPADSVARANGQEPTSVVGRR